MSVQVVQNQPDHRDIGVSLVHQPPHLMGEILHGTSPRYGHPAPTRLGFADQEQVARSRPLVLLN